MMTRFFLFAVGVLGSVLVAVVTGAQGPPTPEPPCSVQLNTTMFQWGETLKQVAIARARLEEMTKERDQAKAEVAALKPTRTEPEKK